MIPRVNRIFLRRSGVAKAERNALSTRDLLGGTGRAAAWPVSSWPAVAGGGLAWVQTSHAARLRDAGRLDDSNRPTLTVDRPATESAERISDIGSPRSRAYA